jgi:hypothetical protein
MEVGMRILKIAAFALVAAGLLGGASFTSAPAKAQGFSVDIGAGPGVRYRDRDDDYWRYRHRYRAETFGSGCRTVIRRIYRGDREVVIRRRVCD